VTQLREAMLEELQLRNYASTTVRACVNRAVSVAPAGRSPPAGFPRSSSRLSRRPSIDSTPIAGPRARRRRQRLHSNGSIESDPAAASSAPSHATAPGHSR
jgi:hypothetical protein